jgi:hypothetical protein
MGINEITYAIRGAVFDINPRVFTVFAEKDVKAEIRRMVLNLPEGKVV